MSSGKHSKKRQSFTSKVEQFGQTRTVCPINDAVVHAALALPFADVEDAVQASAATAAGLDARAAFGIAAQ
jgi:hypothetical protein